MGKVKVLTAVVLVALVLFCCISVFKSINVDTTGDYDESLALATDYMDRGLYQLAIQEYDKAIEIKDSQNLRDLEIEAYEKRYEESDDIISDYISAVKSACDAYAEEPKYYVTLANTYLLNEDYQSAYDSLKIAKENEVESEEIEELYEQIKYSFTTDWNTYEDISSCVNGTYLVMKSELWGSVDESGDASIKNTYDFLSPVGSEGIVLFVKDEVKQLIDEDDIVRGKIDFIPTGAKAYSEGLMAISNGETYGYYNSLGDYKFGKFLDAGIYQNGFAAVKTADDNWMLIDKKGNTASDKNYKSIKLGPGGEYISGDIILAMDKDKYSIYDSDFKKVSDFECDDIDTPTEDGIIAFKQDEKWGFVDASGEIIIEPEYDDAKSFSNGYAAVCKDNKWGFIDESGKMIIDYQFYDADYFNSENKCFVKTSESTWQMLEFKVEF